MRLTYIGSRSFKNTKAAPDLGAALFDKDMLY